jgi:hypothetical protein
MLACRLAKNRVAVMTSLRVLIVGAVLAAAMAGIANAQVKDNPLKLDEIQRRKDDVAVDKQYKATLERTRKEAPETRSDPWQNMRGGDDSNNKR